MSTLKLKINVNLPHLFIWPSLRLKMAVSAGEGWGGRRRKRQQWRPLVFWPRARRGWRVITYLTVHITSVIFERIMCFVNFYQWGRFNPGLIKTSDIYLWHTWRVEGGYAYPTYQETQIWACHLSTLHSLFSKWNSFKKNSRQLIWKWNTNANCSCIERY